MNLYDKLIYYDLYLDIYIAGNYNEGESILILLKSQKKIIHSLIMDSFEGIEKNNPLLDYIKDLETIDMVIWTHPHEDHSKGLLNIIDSYNIREIVVPEFLIGSEHKYCNIADEIFAKLQELSSVRLNRRNRTNITSANTNKYLLNNEIVRTEYKDFSLSIWTLSPSSDIVRNRIANNNFNQLNDFSISLYYCIDNDFFIFLGGDVEDITLNQLNGNVLQNMPVPDILKIPHHGSLSTKRLLRIYDSDYKKISIAATTAYASYGLPSEEIIAGYRAISDMVFRVSPDYIDGDAILNVNIDLLKKSIKIKQKTNFID